MDNEKEIVADSENEKNITIEATEPEQEQDKKTVKPTTTQTQKPNNKKVIEKEYEDEDEDEDNEKPKPKSNSKPKTDTKALYAELESTKQQLDKLKVEHLLIKNGIQQGKLEDASTLFVAKGLNPNDPKDITQFISTHQEWIASNSKNVNYGNLDIDDKNLTDDNDIELDEVTKMSIELGIITKEDLIASRRTN